MMKKFKITIKIKGEKTIIDLGNEDYKVNLIGDEKYI
jgi:hypothetical protein